MKYIMICLEREEVIVRTILTQEELHAHLVELFSISREAREGQDMATHVAKTEAGIATLSPTGYYSIPAPDGKAEIKFQVHSTGYRLQMLEGGRVVEDAVMDKTNTTAIMNEARKSNWTTQTPKEMYDQLESTGSLELAGVDAAGLHITVEV